MRTFALLLAMLPALALGQDPAEPVAPPKKATKDQVYKWVDKDGVIHYSGQPPTDNVKPAKLPPLQTYKGGTNPNLSKFDKPVAKGAAGAAQIEVVTPSHDETFRGGERVVPVAVMVTPQLRDGQNLIYMLDGVPQSPPTPDTSYALTEVERGTHTVTVSVVDANGEQLGTSTGVTFHMKPTVQGQAEKIQDRQRPPQQQPKPQPKPKPP